VTLLQTVIDEASGNDVGVASLLRKVKVLAARTRTVALADWVSHELNGYPQDTPLPVYRGPIETGVRAQMGGEFGPMVSNLPIPPGAFPDDLVEQGWLFRTEFRQPIEGLESFIGAEVQPTLAWSPDKIRVINAMIRRGEIRLHEMPMYFINADQHVSAQTFVDIVSAVRNRVLDLALEFERLDPEIGQPGAPAPDPAAAAMIVTNIIGSTVANLDVASPGAHQHVAVGQGDLDALLDRLRELGVTDDDLDDLTDAIDHDGAEPGSRVSAWLGRFMLGVGAVTTAATGQLIADAIGGYYGIGL